MFSIDGDRCILPDSFERTSARDNHGIERSSSAGARRSIPFKNVSNKRMKRELVGTPHAQPVEDPCCNTGRLPGIGAGNRAWRPQGCASAAFQRG